MPIHYKAGRYRDERGRFISASRGRKSSIARREFKSEERQKKKIKRIDLYSMLNIPENLDEVENRLFT